ncbi:DUF6248 family natural product biosynthesis protein [Streptomyces sp. JV178]|uniref:DUF6248 family natural product biosynthesis protein n=1 Tax=Streptomyces sp. JV178 TaxID=858632 RepID=UPI0034D45BBF
MRQRRRPPQGFVVAVIRHGPGQRPCRWFCPCPHPADALLAERAGPCHTPKADRLEAQFRLRCELGRYVSLASVFGDGTADQAHELFRADLVPAWKMYLVRRGLAEGDQPKVRLIIERARELPLDPHRRQFLLRAVLPPHCGCTRLGHIGQARGLILLLGCHRHRPLLRCCEQLQPKRRAPRPEHVVVHRALARSSQAQHVGQLAGRAGRCGIRPGGWRFLRRIVHAAIMASDGRGPSSP